MKNFAVICFLVAVTAVLFVQRISGDDGFWYGEELHDVEKRQTWDTFYKEYVVEVRGYKKNNNYWNSVARKKLGEDYGVRPFKTFIQVWDKIKILAAFNRRQVCSNGYAKSDRKFTLVEMTWNAASGKYSVNYPGMWHICVELNEKRRPVYLHGRE